MPEKARNVIRPQVRKVRSGKGLSQAELAKRLQLAGLDWGRVEVAKVEARIKRTNDADLYILAEVLGVSLEALYPTAKVVHAFHLNSS